MFYRSSRVSSGANIHATQRNFGPQIAMERKSTTRKVLTSTAFCNAYHLLSSANGLISYNEPRSIRYTPRILPGVDLKESSSHLLHT